MNILFLTNLLPYPLDNGGKIKTYTTIKALFVAGHRIDLICFKETRDSMEKEETELQSICNSVKQVYLPLTTAIHKKYMIGIAVRSIFSSLPFSIYKYQSKEMHKELYSKKMISYDIVYFDHLPMCVYFDYTSKLWPNSKKILDEHNCETTIISRKMEQTHNILKKSFLKFETLKLKKFEARSIENVDKSIVLSQIDYDSLKLLVSHDFDHSIISIGIPDKGIKVFNKNERLNILFIGTLTWEPNNAGLIWFLNEVMPVACERNIDFHLFIVGKNPSREVKDICAQYKSKITLTGYVESVDEYYDMCECMIVPLFIGSGQRVKLIEAFSKGMPAISTTIGAEGLEYINGENIIIADDKYSFVEALIKMTEEKLRKEIRISSRSTYEKYYAPKAISSRIRDAIEE